MIENTSIFKKKTTFIRISPFYNSQNNFGNFSNENTFSKTAFRVSFENSMLCRNFIFSFFTNLGLVINSFFLSEKANAIFIYIEFFEVPSKSTKLFSFKTCLAYLKKHLELNLFYNKPVIFQLTRLNDCCSTTDLSKNIPILLQNDLKIFLIFLIVSRDFCVSNAFSFYISSLLEKTKSHQKLLDSISNLCRFFWLNKSFSNMKLKGFKFQVKGRLQGSDRTRTYCQNYGKVVTKFSKTTTVGKNVAITPYGSFGVEASFFYNNTLLKMSFFEPISQNKRKIRRGKLKTLNKSAGAVYVENLRYKQYVVYSSNTGFLRSVHFKEIQRSLKKYLHFNESFSFYLFPYKSFSKKGIGSRMGKGKGLHSFYCAPVQKGAKILSISVSNVTRKKKIEKLLSSLLPISIVVRLFSVAGVVKRLITFVCGTKVKGSIPFIRPLIFFFF